MKRLLLWTCVLFMVGITICQAGKLSSYPFTAVMNNGDYIPVIVSSSNQNINWATTKTIMTQGINWQALPSKVQGTNINWTNIRVYGSSFGGDHSGINWTSFGV